MTAQHPPRFPRAHIVTEVAPGMEAIAGCKLTTYRDAADAVDFALGEQAKRTL